MDKSKRLKLVRNVLLLFPAAIGATLPAATLENANGLAVLAFRRISGNPTTNGNERSEAR